MLISEAPVIQGQPVGSVTLGKELTLLFLKYLAYKMG